MKHSHPIAAALLLVASPFGLFTLGHATERLPSSQRITRPAAEAAKRQELLQPFKAPKDPSHIKVAFFDADSTLRIAPSGGVSANDATDVIILPGVAKVLKALADDGYFIAIVSNQGGIAQGHITLETAQAALAYTASLIREAGGVVHLFDFAEALDDFRKPKIGMALRIEGVLKAHFGKTAAIDRNQSLMVGDSAYKAGQDQKPDGSPGTHFSNSDRLFAENLGVRFFEPTDLFCWRAHGIDVFTKKAEVDAYVAQFGEPKDCTPLWR